MKNNSKKNEIVIDKDGFKTVKNLPTKNELSEFYVDFMRNDSTRPKNYQTSYSKKEKQHINLLNELRIYAIFASRPKWKKKKITSLEVGVGEGFTMSHAESKGWKVHGIDFSDTGIKKFNPKMLDKVQIGDAFDILNKIKQKFDICMINNVLEHVIDPRKMLENLRFLLKKEGIISITIPNDFSHIQNEALKLGHIKEEFWVDTPEHLHYFNTENIQKFINKQNFKILDMYSTFPLDFFLFHPGSNYINNEKKGKQVHHARVNLDLILSKSGMLNYYKLCQSFAACNVGRNFTVIISPEN